MTKKRLGLFLLLAGLPALLRAEATKEYTRDAGIYNVDAFTILTGEDISGQLSLDFNFPGDSAPPEGLLVASTTVETQGAYWGIFETTAFNNFTVTQRDFSAYVNGHLRFWLKSNSSLDVKIEYNNVTPVQVSSTIASTGGIWTEFSIPLSTGGFGMTAANLQNIRAPFIVVAPVTAAKKQFFLDHIRWTKPVSSLAIFPVTTQVNPGKNRQFTVEGRDAAKDRIILYSTFTAAAAAGTMNPAVPIRVTASTLTAAGSAGSGAVTAKTVGVSTSATVTVTTVTIDTAFGLLSETVPGIVLDTDSKLFYSFGGGGGSTSPVTAVEPSADVREGSQRFKTTIHPQSAAGSYSGWLLNWGLDGSTSVVKNLSAYYDGSIRFWLKAPSSLQANLQMGIYSPNCEQGFELSKVMLSKYATFDGAWHAVTIPLKDLAGARPWADLSRLKTLLDIFAIGNTGGSDQTFYIDNLRLDTRTPGPLHHIAVSPNPAFVPLNAKRTFTAQGFDSTNMPVDFFPVWSKSDTTGNIGTLSSTQSLTTLLSASPGGGTGTITATEASVSSTTNVTVATVTYTQSYNVYSDIGSGGTVGVSTGGSAGTLMLLSQQPNGVPGDTQTVRRATYTLSGAAAFAVWYTDESNGTRFMRFYANGYLHFWVKTTRDLQFSVRSSNIAPGAERCKFRLSELGVPLNGVFQEVLVSLADFKAREPLLDFDSIKTYFTIGALASQIGPVTNQVFDVDDVKWLTSSTDAPAEDKVLAHLIAKQHSSSGLVLSFDSDASSRAVTYDQALAAMAFTYRQDLNPKGDTYAKKIFDAYNARFNAGSFNGFHDEYKWDVANAATILVSTRTAGPNAWMLLALLHYRSVTGIKTYDRMMAGIAGFLISLQDATDRNSLRYGKSGATGNTIILNKSTEHNLDGYAAFKAYSTIYSTYSVAGSSIAIWLNTSPIWTGTRLNLGKDTGGNIAPEKALDCYSWAVLAVSSFSSVLPLAETDFESVHNSALTGVPIDGFDFSASPGIVNPDKDSVWLEGTGQMAVAYYATGDSTKGNKFVQEIEKGIFPVSASDQGIPYATNAGTAYGFTMDSQHAAVSSMAWYLFAKRKFNPFKPYPLYGVNLKTVSTGVVASSMTWTVNVPAQWVRANHYVQLDAQPVSTAGWGIQIYTDNMNPAFTPRFVDPSPGVTTNPDSNPAGLLKNVAGQTTTYITVPLAWRIQDSLSSVPAPIRPFTILLGSQGPESFNWFYFKDRSTPAIDYNGNGNLGDPADGTVFGETQDEITLRKPYDVGGGVMVDSIHTSQGPNGYTAGLNPDYVFIEADFSSAAAQINYQTQIIVEFYLQ